MGHRVDAAGTDVNLLILENKGDHVPGQASVGTLKISLLQ
jgi:hypothetical protein